MLEMKMKRMRMILESCIISCESCKDRFEGLPGLNRRKALAFKRTSLRNFGL